MWSGHMTLRVARFSSNNIDTLFQKVSPYDYEKIGFLLNLLKTKCNKETLSLDVERGLKLLECVKRLTRQAPLSIVENNWIKKWKSCTKVHVHVYTVAIVVLFWICYTCTCSY